MRPYTNGTLSAVDACGPGRARGGGSEDTGPAIADGTDATGRAPRHAPGLDLTEALPGSAAPTNEKSSRGGRRFERLRADDNTDRMICRVSQRGHDWEGAAGHGLRHT